MWTQEEIERVTAEVVRRSMSDIPFRSLALANPKAAVAKITDEPIPDGLKIQFVDNAGAYTTVVLPDLPVTEGELADSELEQIAGGGRGSQTRCGENSFGC